MGGVKRGETEVASGMRWFSLFLFSGRVWSVCLVTSDTYTLSLCFYSFIMAFFLLFFSAGRTDEVMAAWVNDNGLGGRGGEGRRDELDTNACLPSINT